MVNWTTAPGPMFWTLNSSTPGIYSFSASPTLVAPSGSSTLSGMSQTPHLSLLLPGSFSTSTLSGSTIVNPTSTTTYTLTATNVRTAPASRRRPTLTATPVSQTKIHLSWATSTDSIGVSIDDVYQNGVNIATTSATTYANTGLMADTAYTYTVDAFDSLGNYSAQSSSTVARTQGGSNFNGPTGIALDASVSADSATANTLIVSPSFSTASANELLLAFVSGCGSTPWWITANSVTGGGLTWNLVGRAGQPGEEHRKSGSGRIVTTSIGFRDGELF